MKKVLVDVTTLSDQYKGRGIGNYTKNLVEELIKIDEFTWQILGFNDMRNRFPNREFFNLGDVNLSTPRNILTFRKQFIPKIKKSSCDLYFTPNLERGLPLGICPTAVMIHDISPKLSNSYSSKGFVKNFLKGLFYKYQLRKAKKADLVLTNSHFTKTEIVKDGFYENRIRVTHLAAGAKFDNSIELAKDEEERIRTKYCLDGDYILYYGGLEINKNIPNLLRTFSLIRQSKDINLCILDKNLYREGNKIVARSENAQFTKSVIKNLKLERSLRLPGFVEEDDLPKILKLAKVFVHLSTYEGFGIAVLEAISTGIPVVASNLSSYPEVLDNGAELVDPQNNEEVRDAVLKLIGNTDYPEDLIERGLKVASRYSWSKTAKVTVEAFISVV